MDDANDLESSVSAARTKHFDEEFKAFATEVERALPKGVNPANMMLPWMLKTFKEQQVKSDWAKFTDATRAAFTKKCVDAGEEQLREMEKAKELTGPVL